MDAEVALDKGINQNSGGKAAATLQQQQQQQQQVDTHAIAAVPTCSVATQILLTSLSANGSWLSDQAAAHNTDVGAMRKLVDLAIDKARELRT